MRMAGTKHPGHTAANPQRKRKAAVLNVLEDPIHRAINQFLELVQLTRSPEGHSQLLFWHTPNGGLRHPAVAKLLKQMGARAGVPDYFVCVAKGLLIAEVKSTIGTYSASQEAFQAELGRYLTMWGVPHEFVVWRSVNDACADLKRWGLKVPEVI